jgi:hypothetical protein
MKGTKEEIYKGLPASKGISAGKIFVFKSELPDYNLETSPGVIRERDNRLRRSDCKIKKRTG